ncbi:hypothetical protein Fuma_00787 [Fuerstiella marisgermanici]|uniref:Uncharacterized protein n=1 Tax=Fuerstiella marisgermanici TaxID=1891926 RepID=A0A1P8WAX9_9PLAN|nr:hypothetical protein Fuma_00787 [Fuerstiella marisgermanici]
MERAEFQQLRSIRQPPGFWNLRISAAISHAKLSRKPIWLVMRETICEELRSAEFPPSPVTW